MHVQNDVLRYLDHDWDLMIAHPPCTYLSNAGLQWLRKRPGRMLQLINGALFFKQLMSAPIPRIAIENPIMIGEAKAIIGKQDQIIHPWQFGHGETKPICLWLKNLPPLVPTKIISDPVSKHNAVRNNDERWKVRSRTFEGIAEAMAEQWQ